MKHIFFFCIILFALPAFGQRGEIVKDTIYFGTTVNECGDTMFSLTEIVELRGGRTFTNSQPVGFDENNPCSGIGYKDTTTLLNFYKNPLIDYGRQQAEKAREFIFQARSLKTFAGINTALVNLGAGNLLREIENGFADSLVGSYILVRPSVANANVTTVKTANGALRVRISAQTFFPVVLYGDKWMLLQNIAGAGQHVDLYEIEPGRWVSLLGNYQLVKAGRQVVGKGK